MGQFYVDSEGVTVYIEMISLGQCKGTDFIPKKFATCDFRLTYKFDSDYKFNGLPFEVCLANIDFNAVLGEFVKINGKVEVKNVDYESEKDKYEAPCLNGGDKILVEGWLNCEISVSPPLLSQVNSACKKHSFMSRCIMHISVWEDLPTWKV